MSAPMHSVSETIPDCTRGSAWQAVWCWAKVRFSALCATATSSCGAPPSSSPQADSSTALLAKVRILARNCMTILLAVGSAPMGRRTGALVDDDSPAVPSTGRLVSHSGSLEPLREEISRRSFAAAIGPPGRAPAFPCEQIAPAGALRGRQAGRFQRDVDVGGREPERLLGD